MDNEEFAEALIEAYNEMYDEPRNISYWEIEEGYETDTLGETDAVAAAIDLGVRHSQNDMQRLGDDEILEMLARQ